MEGIPFQLPYWFVCQLVSYIKANCPSKGGYKQARIEVGIENGKKLEVIFYVKHGMNLYEIEQQFYTTLKNSLPISQDKCEGEDEDEEYNSETCKVNCINL